MTTRSRAVVVAALTVGLFTVPARAAPVGVDGVLGLGEYGAATAHVSYDPAAPNGNFQTPGTTNTVAYDIYQKSSNGYYYALFKADPSGGGSTAGAAFVNAYYDLDPAAGTGSDIIFSINGTNGVVTAISLTDFSQVTVGNATVATSVDGNTIEYALPISDFQALSGLNYSGPQGFPIAGDKVVLRLSQTFGYAVAGGALGYGADRLGAVTLAAADLPEPAALTVLVSGLAGLGFARRRGAAKLA